MHMIVSHLLITSAVRPHVRKLQWQGWLHSLFADGGRPSPGNSAGWEAAGCLLSCGLRGMALLVAAAGATIMVLTESWHLALPLGAAPSKPNSLPESCVALQSVPGDRLHPLAFDHRHP